MSKEVLAVTMVRGGSKGLPRKNVRPLLGKPLMVWSIEHAKASKLVTRYVVTTEDEEMKKIALKHGVDVIDRPPELAQDETSAVAVLQHVLKAILPNEPDALVLIQATSPIRKKGIIDMCIKQFFKEDADTLVTGYQFKDPVWGEPIERRQNIKGFFVNDGNVYVFKPSMINKGDLIGKKWSFVFTSKEENVDIDDEFDFWLAGKVLEERML